MSRPSPHPRDDDPGQTWYYVVVHTDGEGNYRHDNEGRHQIVQRYTTEVGTNSHQTDLHDYWRAYDALREAGFDVEEPNGD